MNPQHPPITWPKPYLLEVYKRAVEEGCVRIKLPSQKHYDSFSMALYRLRRRSDAQHAAFILPEYHLVTCAWEPMRGSVLVTFNKLPDGNELPSIESVKSTEAAPVPDRPTVEWQMDQNSEPEFDPESFVQNLVDEAGRRLGDDSRENLLDNS